MNLIPQIGLLFAVCLAGSGISAVLPFPFPSSVASMLLLFLLLALKILRPARVETVCGFLQKNMAIFFVPSGAGVISCLDTLWPVLWQVLLICVVSTLLTFGVTQWTVRGVIALQNKWRGGGRHGKTPSGAH